MLATRPASIVSYWRQRETSGTVATDSSGNGNHGAYRASGEPLLGQNVSPFIAALYDGGNDYLNGYSASLAAAFNGQEGSFVQWIKPLSWDTTTRRLGYFQADSSNRVICEKTTAAGQLALTYIAGGTAKSLFTVVDTSDTGWLLYGATWSKTANHCRLYINGCQVENQSSIGTFAGSLSSTNTTIGSAGLGANTWNGYLTEAELWNAELTPYEMAALYNWQASRRIIFEGDSRTIGSQSTISYPRQVQAALTTPRQCPVIAVLGAPVTNFATTTLNSAYRSGDVAAMWGGLNDATAGASAATIYSRIAAWHTAVRAAGFKTIACTEIDAQSADAIAVNWSSSIMPALNTLLRAGWSTFADGLADLAADSRLMNANDTTYADADKKHWKTAGNAVIASIVKTAAEAL